LKRHGRYFRDILGQIEQQLTASRGEVTGFWSSAESHATTACVEAERWKEKKAPRSRVQSRIAE
jgi:hypothetical protein